MVYMDGRERKCPVCGKVFLLPPENVYKLQINREWQHFCSYTCYRSVQKQIEAKRNKKRGIDNQ